MKTLDQTSLETALTLEQSQSKKVLIRQWAELGNMVVPSDNLTKSMEAKK